MPMYVNGVWCETTELDKEATARERRPGLLGEFLDWLEVSGIFWVVSDSNGDGEAAVSRSMLTMLAHEVMADALEPIGSQRLGDIMQCWRQHGLVPCYHYGDRCPWPYESEGDLEPGWPVELAAGYYAVALSTERMLARFYGINSDVVSREREAILAALRS